MLVNLKTDANGLAVARVDMGDVRHVDRRFKRLEAARVHLGRLLVALHDANAANHNLVLVRDHLQYFALGALVLARDDDDGVALLDLRSHDYRTSGAMLAIFTWFFARSSRGTGPKTRVPMGSPLLLMRTAAFESKRIVEPSARLMSFDTRTTTALRTSPFFTRPVGIASLIETTITSPTEA